MLWGLGYPLIRGSMGSIGPSNSCISALTALLSLGLLFRRELRKINR
jgi:hypothetical protein